MYSERHINHDLNLPSDSAPTSDGPACNSMGKLYQVDGGTSGPSTLSTKSNEDIESDRSKSEDIEFLTVSMGKPLLFHIPSFWSSDGPMFREETVNDCHIDELENWSQMNRHFTPIFLDGVS